MRRACRASSSHQQDRKDASGKEKVRGNQKQQPDREKGVKSMTALARESSDSDTNEDLNTLFSFTNRAPIMVSMEVEGEPMQMELDTGAAVSVISKKEYGDL